MNDQLLDTYHQNNRQLLERLEDDKTKDKSTNTNITEDAIKRNQMARVDKIFNRIRKNTIRNNHGIRHIKNDPTTS